MLTRAVSMSPDPPLRHPQHAYPALHRLPLQQGLVQLARRTLCRLHPG
ncbi:MAG: hypothetical protein RL091_2967, partial [Verrucomicrobiota bacterium]